jgi:hypothetical protein
MKRLIALATAVPFVLSLGCAQDDKKSADQPAAAEKSAAAPAPGKGDRGNWDVIDKNNDNYISAEEMESWLKANPGPGKK